MNRRHFMGISASAGAAARAAAPSWQTARQVDPDYRVRQYKDVNAHDHTAGVPGHGELEAPQEMNDPAVIPSILQADYKGFVAQEFIPTWPDAALTWRHAASICEVSSPAPAWLALSPWSI